MRENTLFDIEEVAIASSKSNEWYTPSRYIEAARTVMGGIDLDPASCAVANQIVKASRIYTKEDNGLAQEWKARSVWLNPPYSAAQSPMGMSGGKQRGPTGLWIQKLIDAFNKGDVLQPTVCINADTVRAWFQPFWDHTICFVSHPIQFLRVNQKPEHHFFGSAIIYLGPNISSFAQTFSEFGPVVLPSGVIRRPAPLPQPSLWDLEVS